MSKRLLGTGRAATELGISQATILRAVHEGALKPDSVTAGGHFRFSRETLQAYARTHSAGGGTVRADFELISSKALAERLGLSQATIVRAVQRGLIEPTLVTPGGHYRFAPDSMPEIARVLHHVTVHEPVTTGAAVPEIEEAPEPEPDPAAAAQPEAVSAPPASPIAVPMAGRRPVFIYAPPAEAAPAIAEPLSTPEAADSAVPATNNAIQTQAEPPPPVVAPSAPPLRVLPPVPARKPSRWATLRHSSWREVATAVFFKSLIVTSMLAASLPALAVVRGIAEIAGRIESYGPAQRLGLAFSLVALLTGAVFFAYSIKYYLGTAVVLLSTLIAPVKNGNGNGKKHASGLMRIVPRWNHNGNGNGNGNGHHGNGHNGNGNGNGHFDLGYEPFVSVQIASYNEKRVIERLLEACSRFEYSNYEVILVDDSTDESTEILAGWQGRERFKIIHRSNRSGFKGGALREALKIMDPRTEYVMILDADAIPFPDAIQSFLPYFYEKRNGNGHDLLSERLAYIDPEIKAALVAKKNAKPELRRHVGAVQSYQWHVLNKSESWLTEAVRSEYAGSYMIERPFQEHLGSLKMIAGTAYMIRADLLRKLGWGTSLTEDWELTLKLYELGYKVAYTPYAEVPAECVGTFGRLARQRMRWAEGHSFNVRRYFWPILRSPHLGWMEKFEFIYYSSYYLQAVFFLAGTLSWLLAEVVFKVHVPDWTAILGWSLLFSNLFSLPLMNIGGLLLEGAPNKDFTGVIGGVAVSYLLVPFQAYAALKGLFEKEEGPWFRTPKTGKITDPVKHLRRLTKLRKWLFGNGNGNGHGKGGPRLAPVPVAVQATPPPPRRPSRRIAWIVTVAMVAALGGLGVNATHATPAYAATSWYMHGWSSTVSNTVTLVRSASKTETAAATTLVTTISSNNGDLLVVFIAIPNSTTGISSVTDSAGNTYFCNCGVGGTSSALDYRWVSYAKAVTSITVTFTASTLATMYVLEFSGTSTAIGIDNTNGSTANGTSTSPGTTTAKSPISANAVAIGAIQSPASVTYSAGPTFTSGTTNNLTKVESTGGGSTEDLIAGYDLPGSTSGQTYAGTYSASNQWSAALLWAEPAGNLDNTAPGGSTIRNYSLTNGSQEAWETGFTVGSQTVAAGTYTFTYWTGSCSGSCTVTATLTFGYGSSSECASITALASWSASLVKGSSGATTNTTTGSSATIAANSYICWSIAVTATSGGTYSLEYDTTTITTNINTPTITVPEYGLALLGVALIAPLVARRRQREKLIELIQTVVAR